MPITIPRFTPEPAPAAPRSDNYLLNLRQSGLVPFEQLADITARFGQDDNGQLLTPVELGARLVEAGILTKWQHAKLAEGKHEGFVLGHYLLRDHIANGAIAAVFEAEHTKTKARVAIKILKPELATKTSYLERFEREAEAAQLLKHPNVIQVLDVGCANYASTGPLHYLVTEFANEKHLEQVVQERGPLPLDVAVEYVRQAAKGLACAHRHGIVHRNLKPNNLLVDDMGQVRITNLGVARFLNDEDSESLTLRYQEKVIGTAAYMAPEQVVNSHKVEPRSDLYSLGCIFYFLLTGKPPFTAEGVALMMQQLHDKPPALAKVRPGVPERLSVLCDTLLAKTPEERYATAGQVADELSNWLLGAAVPWANRNRTPG